VKRHLEEIGIQHAFERTNIGRAMDLCRDLTYVGGPAMTKAWSSHCGNYQLSCGNRMKLRMSDSAQNRTDGR